MNRRSIWSIRDRYNQLFVILMVISFLVGLALRYIGDYDFCWCFSFIKDMRNITLFSVGLAFVIVEGVDALMLGILHSTRAERLRTEGREEGIEYAIRHYREWFENGGSKNGEPPPPPPPFKEKT